MLSSKFLKSLEKIIYLFFLFICPSQINSATCISTGSGLWSNSATWSCGAVPTCGDSIILQAGHTVSITSHQNYSGCTNKMPLVIKGTLYFSGGSKLRLPCSSNIYIYSGGSLQSDGSGASNQLEICGTNYWSGNDGTVSGPSCFPPTGPACGVVLPIELVYFSGSACKGEVCLTWVTATEKNNDFFEVQKLEEGEFKTISKVYSKAVGGNSQITLSYGFNDANVEEDVHYYRLKQVDTDGSFKIFNVIYVDFKNKLPYILNIYPNPNNGEFIIKGFGPNTNEIIITIENFLGETIYQSLYSEINESRQVIVKPTPTIQAGVHICSLLIAGIKHQIKMIVN